MFVGMPGSKMREVVENFLRVRVENVRAVLMDQDPRVIETIESISADMSAPIAEQDRLIKIAPQAFGQHTAGKTGPDNEVIVGHTHAAVIAAVELRQIASSTCASSFATIESHEF